MTPAEKAGIKVGDKCIVIADSDEQSTFKIGEVVYFIYDDGTNQPRFSRTPDDEDDNFFCDYIYLKNVKLFEEKKTPKFNISTQEISYNVTILTFKRLLTQDELDKIAEILEK